MTWVYLLSYKLGRIYDIEIQWNYTNATESFLLLPLREICLTRTLQAHLTVGHANILLVRRVPMKGICQTYDKQHWVLEDPNLKIIILKWNKQYRLTITKPSLKFMDEKLSC